MHAVPGIYTPIFIQANNACRKFGKQIMYRGFGLFAYVVGIIRYNWLFILSYYEHPNVYIFLHESFYPLQFQT